jgi:hypothetical protein
MFASCDSWLTVAYLNEPHCIGSSNNQAAANCCTLLGSRLRISGQGERMAMRLAAYKEKIKAVAARLSLAALALAMGIGATSAIFHPRLLDVMRPSASASVFACKATDGDAMPAAHDMPVEPQKLIRVTSEK